MKVRFPTLLAALAAAAMLMSGWPAPARAEIKVGVSDWTGWVAWYVAENQGYFKKYGANVKLVWFANYSDSIAALSTGQLDANSQTWSDTLGPLQKGLPLKVVLVNDNSAGNDALMVSGRIHGWADLKGRTVALEQFSVSHFVLYTALARHGLSPRDVTVVEPLCRGCGGGIHQRPRGRGGGVESLDQPDREVRQGSRPVHLPGHARLIPDLLVAQQSAIQNKRQDLVGMARAWFDTVAFIQNNPDAAVKIMSKVVGMSPSDYKVFLPGTRFFDANADLDAFNAASPASLVAVAPQIAAFLLGNRLIDGKPDATRGVDGSILAAALHK